MNIDSPRCITTFAVQTADHTGNLSLRMQEEIDRIERQLDEAHGS